MQNILEALTLYPTFTLVGTLIIGLLIGSFLNVVIYRLPKMMEAEWRQQCTDLLCTDQTDGPKTSTESADKALFNLAVPTSHCPACNHGIRPWENIPVFSYLFLRGKCAACKAPISLRYPIIELATGLLSLCVIYFFGVSYLGLAALVFTWSLIALTMIDFDTQLLPDDITLPLLWLGLIVNSFGLIVPLEDALWGAIGGYLSLWSIYWLFKIVTGKEGMGYGDFKLLAALGAWMGWQFLPQIILLSSFVGAFLGIAMIIIKGRDKNIPIPFGPYLAIAGWIAFVWGDHINRTYLHLFTGSH